MRRNPYSAREEEKEGKESSAEKKERGRRRATNPVLEGVGAE